MPMNFMGRDPFILTEGFMIFQAKDCQKFLEPEGTELDSGSDVPAMGLCSCPEVCL